jgi:hypothetical protein
MNDDEKLLTDADRVAIGKYKPGTIDWIAARHHFATKRRLEREGRRDWTDWGDDINAPRPPLPDLRTTAEKEGRTDLEARRQYQKDWVARKRRRLASESGA